MFLNNPNIVEKLIQVKQDDIVRGLPDPSTYEFQSSPGKMKNRRRAWVAVGVLAALAWLFSVLT